MFPLVQKILKSTKKRRSYNQKQSGTFLWLTVYRMHITTSLLLTTSCCTVLLSLMLLQLSIRNKICGCIPWLGVTTTALRYVTRLRLEAVTNQLRDVTTLSDVCLAPNGLGRLVVRRPPATGLRFLFPSTSDDRTDRHSGRQTLYTLVRKT